MPTEHVCIVLWIFKHSSEPWWPVPHSSNSASSELVGCVCHHHQAVLLLSCESWTWCQQLPHTSPQCLIHQPMTTTSTYCNEAMYSATLSPASQKCIVNFLLYCMYTDCLTKMALKCQNNISKVLTLVRSGLKWFTSSLYTVLDQQHQQQISGITVCQVCDHFGLHNVVVLV